MDDTTIIARRMIQRGQELLSRPYEPIVFTKHPEADKMLNNLEKFPHAFVLACVMDLQIKAERAWLIPYMISQDIGGFEFDKLIAANYEVLRDIFKSKSLHRFNDIMSKRFYEVIHVIHDNYEGDASNIWEGNPRSATIVSRFLDLKGVGVKIATMATNILARDFKIPMQDKICIDISPDVQVRKVFKRLGLIGSDASIDHLLYRARELNPHYPGIFDLTAWEIGRYWCKNKLPICSKCYLNDVCPKIGVDEMQSTHH